MIRRRRDTIRWRSGLAEEKGEILEGAERLAVMENEDHTCGEGGKGVIDGRDHVSMFQS